MDAFGSRIIAGEVDYQARGISIGNFTLFKENESQGDYRVLLGVTAGHEAFQPNQTTKNEKLREFFQNRDVRIALSHAINRQEINDLIFNGTATPRQYSPIEASPQNYEKLSNAYIEFDPEKANQMLDAAGYAAKDAEGFRLWKDGSGTLSFTIEGTTTGDARADAAQTVVKYFTDVGVKSAYKAVERALYTEHYDANEIEAAFWGGDRMLLPLIRAAEYPSRHHARPAVGGRLGHLEEQRRRHRRSQRRGAATGSLYPQDLVGLGSNGRRAGRGQAQHDFPASTRRLGRGAADDRYSGRATRADHREERT